MEEWKIINGYDDYEISSLGSVLSLKSQKMMSILSTGYGYLGVNLCLYGVKKRFYIHRLVAEHFVDNPFGHKYVDHIDGDKTNNSSSNLRWTSAKENSNNVNTRDKFGKHLSKKVGMFDINGKLIQTFKSGREAAQIRNLSPGNISTCCRGETKTCGGYVWKFMDYILIDRKEVKL